MHEVVDRHQGLFERLLIHLEAVARHAIIADLHEAITSRSARAPRLRNSPATPR